MNVKYLEEKLEEKLEGYQLLSRIIIKSFISIFVGFLMTYVYDILYFITFIDYGSFRDFLLFLLTTFLWFVFSIILMQKELKEI